jgi:uncharacterized membrane protein YesL
MQLVIWLILTLGLNLYIIKVSKNKNFITLAAPIVFTMTFMAVFEYMFVKIIDDSTRNSLGWKIHKSGIKSFLFNNADDEYNMYKSLKLCKKNEETLKQNVGELNGHFLGIVLSILFVLCINLLYKLQNNQNKMAIVYSTTVSIASIMYLFLFYYANISSKMNLDPTIKNVVFKKPKNNYEKMENQRPKDPVISVRFNNKQRYKRSLEYCKEVCSDSDKCIGFSSYKDRCNQLIIEKSGMSPSKYIDFYLKK